jgi:hypothetical protein
MSFLVVGLGLATSTGCGTGTGTVSGHVTYKGQPIKKGTITFFPKAPKVRPAGGVIQDGKYSLEVPVGEVEIAVLVPSMLPPVEKGKKPPKKKKGQKPDEDVSPKYKDQTKSGLSMTVIKGEQTKDIDLQSEPVK